MSQKRRFHSTRFIATIGGVLALVALTAACSGKVVGQPADGVDAVGGNTGSGDPGTDPTGNAGATAVAGNGEAGMASARPAGTGGAGGLPEACAACRGHGQSLAITGWSSTPYEGPVVVEESDTQTLVVAAGDSTFTVVANGLAPPAIPLATELWLRLQTEISDYSVYPPPYRLTEFWLAATEDSKLPLVHVSSYNWLSFLSDDVATETYQCSTSGTVYDRELRIVPGDPPLELKEGESGVTTLEGIEYQVSWSCYPAAMMASATDAEPLLLGAAAEGEAS